MILVVCDLYIQQIHKNQKRRRRGKQSQHDLTEFATERRYLYVCVRACVPERVCVYVCVFESMSLLFSPKMRRR